MKYTCKRCGYETNTRQALLKHLQRKKVCKVTNENISVDVLLQEAKYVKVVDDDSIPCEYCDQHFNDRSNLNKHKRICKRNPVNEMQVLKNELLALKQQMQEHRSIGNTTTNNIQQVNNFIITNNFGQETYGHITEDFIKACITRQISGIKSLIEKIHFSEEAPENRTVRMKSLKNNLVEVADDQKWVVKDANEAMDTMITNGRKILADYYYNPESGLKQKDFDELDSRIETFLIDIMGKKSNDFYALRRRILALLIEHSDRI